LQKERRQGGLKREREKERQARRKEKNT